MLSFSVHKNILTNGFMSWHLWIKGVIRDEVVEKYNILIEDDNIPGQTNLCSSSYGDFLKLAIDTFVLKTLDKVRLLASINLLWPQKLNYLKRIPRTSLPRKIVIQDKNDE